MGRVHGAALSHLSLTCVHYPPDASIGYKLAALASAWSIACICFAIAKARHQSYSLRHLTSFAGLIATEIVARSLKHLLRQPRPAAAAALLGLGDSPGWPSSHAALAAAFATLETLDRSGATAATPPPFLRTLELCAFWALAVACAASRVVLGYHSVEQAVAGFLVGVGVAAAWSELVVARTRGQGSGGGGGRRRRAAAATRRR